MTGEGCGNKVLGFSQDFTGLSEWLNGLAGFGPFRLVTWGSQEHKGGTSCVSPFLRLRLVEQLRAEAHQVCQAAIVAPAVVDSVLA